MSAVDKRAFRSALGWFATGVAVVTTVDAEGAPVGVTVNSFSSVSLEPPLVLFSLNLKAFSLQAFRESGAFAVNILDAEQRELSARFAGAQAEKWRGLARESSETGVPVLRDALAVFECRTVSRYAGGDHEIFLGEVVAMAALPAGRPLVFCRGAYCGLSTVVEVPALDDHAPSPAGAELSLAGLEPWVGA